MALLSNASVDYLLETTFNRKLARKELLALIHKHAASLKDDEFLFNYVTDMVYFAEGEWFPFISFVEKQIQNRHGAPSRDALRVAMSAKISV